jgi:hypothetical protein
LEERIGSSLALALVKRVVDNGIRTTSVHLLEGSVGSTTSASNEGDNTNDNASNHTSSEGSDNNRGRRDANDGRLDALLLLLFAGSGTAVIRLACRSVAREGLVVTTLESNTNTHSAIQPIVGAGDVLLEAAEGRITSCDLARVRQIADDVARYVFALTSGGVARVNGTADTVVTSLDGGLTGTGLLIAH